MFSSPYYLTSSSTLLMNTAIGRLLFLLFYKLTPMYFFIFVYYIINIELINNIMKIVFFKLENNIEILLEIYIEFLLILF